MLFGLWTRVGPIKHMEMSIGATWRIRLNPYNVRRLCGLISNDYFHLLDLMPIHTIPSLLVWIWQRWQSCRPIHRESCSIAVYKRSVFSTSWPVRFYAVGYHTRAQHMPPELSLGPFSLTQLNLTHQLTDSTQSNPPQNKNLHPLPKPTHNQIQLTMRFQVQLRQLLVQITTISSN